MRYEEVPEKEVHKFERKANIIEELGVNNSDEKTEEHGGSVLIKNGCARWLKTDKEDTLHGLNLHVKPGHLVAIVGQVGAGKSSLLNVILNELPLIDGTVQVRNL